MLVAFLCLTAGLMIGFLLSGILRAGAVSDLRVALALSKHDNQELRSQVGTLLMNSMPYDCSEGLQLANNVSQEVDIYLSLIHI